MKTNYLTVLFTVVSLLGLGACAPINHEFSCNATTADHCLSIEEVNAMTDVEPPKRPSSQPVSQRPRSTHSTQTIWIAPWVDARGHRHPNDTLFARAASN